MFTLINKFVMKEIKIILHIFYHLKDTCMCLLVYYDFLKPWLFCLHTLSLIVLVLVLYISYP